MPGTNAPDSTAILLEIDKRLDALERGQQQLGGRLAGLEIPFWKNWKILGAGGAVLLAIAGYFGSTFMSEPEIQRIIHSKILYSDKALALTLKRGRDPDSNASPLNEEIDQQVMENLRGNDDTKVYLRDIASKHGVRTYSGSRTYLNHRVPIGRVACLILADDDIRELITLSSDAAPRTVAEIDAKCTDANPEETGRTLSFTDFTPLVIPFQANKGDDVEVVVRVRAHRPEAGGFVAVENGWDLIEASLFPDTPVTFDDRLADNVARAKLTIGNDQKRHNIAIFLNETGEAKVDSSRTPDGDPSMEFIVTLFVLVIVTPESKT